MTVDALKSKLGLAFQLLIQSPVEVYAVIGHIVPVGPEPNPAAPFIGRLPAGTGEDVMLVQVFGASGDVALLFVLQDGFSHNATPQSSFLFLLR